MLAANEPVAQPKAHHPLADRPAQGVINYPLSDTRAVKNLGNRRRIGPAPFVISMRVFDAKRRADDETANVAQTYGRGGR
jgi:hypothetical protein